VLNESRRRVSVSRGARLVAAFGVALIVLPLAAFRAVPRAMPVLATVGSATFSSSVAEADTTFELTAPATAGGTLVLDLKTGGRVVIESWDRSQVQVRASLAGSDWRRTRVSLTPAADGVRLESVDSGNGATQISRHVFEVTVPRRFDVRLSSAGGSVSINGVSGTFKGNTGGGEIQIRDAHGKADIHTGGGDVRVSNSYLDGVVSTGGGTVRIEGVTGNLSGFSGGGPVVVNKRGAISVTNAGGANVVSVNTRDDGVHEGSGSGAGSGSSFSMSSSGTGSTYAESAGSGPINVTSAGGALSLPAAPDGARVVTGGGAIRIGPSGGKLYLSTGGGSIDVGPAKGSVVANTGAGNVSVELEGATGHSVDITSGSGHVALIVPASLDAVLDLESAYTNNFGHKTRIVSDIPVNVTETTDWDDSQGTPRRYVRARQTVGRGGPVIRVRTVNGDIQVATAH
jgi:DUF4097 and DUF4098 domain-containing protein YvlB